MSSSAGLLDFFILEASDYIEQLDGLVARAGGAAPDADAFTRSARSLRGSATMAKLGGIAEVSTALERLGRSLRDGSLTWDAALQGASTAAIDDLKILLRGVRTWGEPENRRVTARLADLGRYLSAGGRPQPTPVAAGIGASFLAAEAAQIAAALDAFVARPEARDAFELALGRVRALRGVAALKDLPPLAEVIDAVERAAKPVELRTAAPSAPQLALFAAAVRVLRAAAQEMAARGRPNPLAPEMDEFARASAALDDVLGTSDEIVPVASLFYADAGPHVVSSAPHPPTTPRERFRLEVVSQAEHLRVLIAECTNAPDSAAVGRLGRALRSGVRALQAAAESFGQRELAQFLGRAAERLLARPTPTGPALDPRVVLSLSEIATLLADPNTPPDTIATRIAALSGSTASGLTPPASQPAVVPRRQPTPTGRELQTFLQSGIAGFSTLSERPLSQPVPLVDETVVPIQTLLYTGRGALDRAREIRQEIAREGGAASPDALAELFDLLDLAAAD
jgi:HPt (histidine-containing phosphotransfer) domain-containing protein